MSVRMPVGQTKTEPQANLLPFYKIIANRSRKVIFCPYAYTLSDVPSERVFSACSVCVWF